MSPTCATLKLLLLCGLVGKALTTNFYGVESTRDKIFQHLFSGPDAEVLSIFPSCLIQSDTIDANNVQVLTLNWTETQYEAVLRREKIAALKVVVAVSLLQIFDVNERDCSVTMALQTTTRWNDCRLSWSRSKYNQVSNLTIAPPRFRSMDVFVPETLLLELTNPSAVLSSETEIRVTSLGTLHLERLFTPTISCSLAVEMYPFDSHLCNLTFETLFNSLEVNLTYPSDTSVEDVSRHLLGNGRYVVSDTFEVVFLKPKKTRRWICTEFAYENQDENLAAHCFTDRLVFQLLLRRNPRFYIIHLFIPAFLCLICSAIVFIITPGHMDKVFPSTFTLVSILVFITAAYSEMPETGSTLSWIGLFYFMCIFIVSINCVYSSVSSTMAASKLPVSKSMQKFVTTVGPIFLFDFLPLKPRKSAIVEENLELNPLDEGLHVENEVIGRKEGSSSDDTFTSITWRQVCACLDRIYFLVVFSGSIAVMASFIAIGLNARSKAFQRYASSEDAPFIDFQLEMQNQLRTF